LPYVDYRRTRYRRPPPLPPGWNRRALARPPLWEFVLLSLLLHALAIALFGAPSGGSRQGHAMWGSLTVVLRGAAPDETPSLKVDRAIPQLVPIEKPRPQARPRRALGPTKPAPAPAAPERSAPPQAPPVAAPPVVPPLLDRIQAPEAESPPPPQVPPPTPQQTPEPLEAPPPAPASPPVAPAPVEEAPMPPPVVEPAPASPPPVEPAPVPAAPAETAPVETPALPVPEVTATPPVKETPLETNTLPVPDVSTRALPEKPAQAEPALKASEIPTPVAPQPAPATIEPPAATTLPPPATAAPPAPEIVKPAQPSPPAPSAAPAAPSDEAPSPFRRGEPSPRADYDPTKPALDLDNLRERAAEIAREGSGQSAMLAFPMPPVPPKKSKLEAAIENARKPDCRTAYQGLGLAAVVPLVANEFGEGNCRW